MTIVDSLSTLHMLGLHSELERALRWVETELSFAAITTRVSFFEVVIRLVGGLISGFEITGKKRLLDLAQELADLIIASATDDGTRFFPRPYIYLSRPWYVKLWDRFWDHFESPTAIIVAGSVQLEFRRLSDHTGVLSYRTLAERWSAHIDTTQNSAVGNRPSGKGLFPLGFDPKGVATFLRAAGLDGGGDSFHEYLLKLWVMSNRTCAICLERWRTVSKALIENSDMDEFQGIFVPYHGESPPGVVTHLSCFSAGLFALSSYSLVDVDKEMSTKHRVIAERIADTCHRLTLSTKTGLPREATVLFDDTALRKEEVRQYRLRPEILESYFYLHRLTGSLQYRIWAWDLFHAIVKNCYVRQGNSFATLHDVDDTSAQPQHEDRMETFWLAETLKYLYLIFSEDNVLNLGMYVLTTEGHPLRVIG